MTLTSVGSSPLTRGKLLGAGQYAVHDRLIPAHAGKTPQLSLSGYLPPAHPRSRGENHLSASALSSAKGSSPLTRGKRFSVGAGLRIVRLIPAHAGKTITWIAQLVTSWAHPRSRGENRAPASAPESPIGSSPLTRGKRKVSLEDFQTARLIPAHAGKTSLSTSVQAAMRAHPRSRGENEQLAYSDRVIGGSSPLTRGKLGVRGGCRDQRGLIPAHAGKT